MRIVSKVALAIALGGLTVAGPVYAKKEEKVAAGKPTPAVQKAAYDAQKAAQAGDVATALTNYNTAKAAIVNDDDKMMVGQIGYQIYQKNKDKQLYLDSVNLMLESGKAKPDLQQQLYEIQGELRRDNKDYAGAATAFQKAIDVGATDDLLVPLLVESYALSDQSGKALAALNAGIAKQTAAGKPVPSEWYEKGVQIGYRPKGIAPADLPAVNAQLLDLCMKWVAANPTPHTWNTALRVYEEKSSPDNETRLDIMRLLRAAGALEGAIDYREYAEDSYLRFPNEAMQVLQEGAAKGVVSLTAKGDAADIMGIVKGKVAADKASLPAADKSARAAANGKAALSTADAYTGYGDYAKAIDLYKVALAKGGVDPATVNIRMGWAQALSGDTAGAKASFGAVTGPKKMLADFWIIHLDHPTIPNPPKDAAAATAS